LKIRIISQGLRDEKPSMSVDDTIDGARIKIP
jgi:hypothetical protein